MRTSLCLNSSRLIFKWTRSNNRKAPCIRKLISLQITKGRGLFSVLKLYFEGNVPLHGRWNQHIKLKTRDHFQYFYLLNYLLQTPVEETSETQNTSRDTRSFISFKTVFASLEMAFELSYCSVFMKVHQAYCKNQTQGWTEIRNTVFIHLTLVQ